MHKHRISLNFVVSVLGIAAFLAFAFALAPGQAATNTHPGNILQVTPGVPGDEPVPDIEVVPETGQQQAPDSGFPSWVLWLVLIIAIIALVAALAGRGRTEHIHHDDEL